MCCGREEWVNNNLYPVGRDQVLPSVCVRGPCMDLGLALPISTHQPQNTTSHTIATPPISVCLSLTYPEIGHTADPISLCDNRGPDFRETLLPVFILSPSTSLTGHWLFTMLEFAGLDKCRPHPRSRCYDSRENSASHMGLATWTLPLVKMRAVRCVNTAHALI